MGVTSRDADKIRRRMMRIRDELPDPQHEPPRAPWAASHSLSVYARRYPLAAVGLAAAAGFLLVPRRRTRTAMDTSTPPEQPPPRLAVAGLIPMVWQAVYPLAVRTAQVYAAERIERWIEQQQRDPSPSPGGDQDHERLPE
jgi:hypothetical protein